MNNKPITQEYLANLFEGFYRIEKIEDKEIFLIESKKMNLVVQGKTLEEAKKRYYNSLLTMIYLFEKYDSISFFPQTSNES
jgi:hypothetical protein